MVRLLNFKNLVVDKKIFADSPTSADSNFITKRSDVWEKMYILLTSSKIRKENVYLECTQ